MKKLSSNDNNWQDIHDRIVGLGEGSVRKSHYATLQNRLKELERFRLLLDRAEEAIVVADAESGDIIDANQSAGEYFGRSVSSLLSMQIFDLAPSEFFEEQTLNSDGARRDPVRFNFRRPDGTYFHAQANLKREQLEDSAFLVLTAWDIKWQLQFEEALRQAKEHAEQANIAKTKFLANISHEFRTPLNAILGFSEIISTETFGKIGNAKYAEYANDIFESGHILLELISETLDISKIESDVFELNEEAVNVGNAIGAVFRIVEAQAARYEVILAHSRTANLPLLYCDKLRLNQILINLVSNAIKFNHPEGTVRIDAYLGADGNIAIDVIDTGIGISPEDLSEVMEPFKRSDDPFTRSREGAGLGLYLTKKLVETHGGTVTIDSVLGGGTTVHLSFPPSRTVAR